MFTPVKSKSVLPGLQRSTPFFSTVGQETFFKSAVSTMAVQPKLKVSPPNDPLETEADAIADKVMQADETQVQRKCAACSEEEKVQTKPGTSVGATTATSSFLPRSTADSINGSKGGGMALDSATNQIMSLHFGSDFSKVKIHTGAEASALNQNLHAKAFTTGSDIFFNNGEYRPHTSEGKHLLAHELAHVLQQDSNTIHRQVVDMPEQRVTVGMPTDLSSLSTPTAPGAVSISADPAHVALNSQLPATMLPFTPGGWDGNDIANKLGQYDQIPGTDSDAVRCVQSVALMSHILMGPAAAMDYLSSISLQGMLEAGQMGTRERTALNVIRFVRERIQSRNATYGNMYWAMEAVHDLFYRDDQGTPAATAGTVRGQINPMLDMSRNLVNMDVWCGTPSDLMTQAASLNPGEQFMVNTWSVSFNHYFDIAGADPTRQRLTYTQTDEQDRPIRTVSIRRIDASQKPAGTQIDTNRDHKHGHQMLIFKDATNSHIKMYEPELTPGGNHLSDLTDNPAVMTTQLFNDQPAFEIYKYVQLWGKMVPTPMSPFTL